MPVPRVKTQRRYVSGVRQEQAQRTRLRILDAAHRLFGEYGYAATTIERIAAEAGVAIDTVYAVFRSKRAVLSGLMARQVGGDDQPIARLDRPDAQSVRREPNQRRQLARFVAGARIDDLPAKRVIAGYVKKAMALNESGVTTRQPRPARPPLRVPPAFAAALARNKLARANFAFGVESAYEGSDQRRPGGAAQLCGRRHQDASETVLNFFSSSMSFLIWAATSPSFVGSWASAHCFLAMPIGTA